MYHVIGLTSRMCVATHCGAVEALEFGGMRHERDAVRRGTTTLGCLPAFLGLFHSVQQDKKSHEFLI